MINLLKKYKEIIMYLIIGGFTTLINVISFILLCNILKLDWSISNIISWIISVLFAYITNRSFVFKSKTKKVVKEIISFFVFRILSLLIDMLLMYLLIQILFINNTIAKLVVQVIVIILNYFFSKFIIFKKTSD